MNDAELLQEYAREHSEPAFRQLVERHLALVYSAALRQVGDPAMAQDVTQVVFIILARKAARLSERTIVTGWLYRTTRNAASKALRSEQRRRRREREAVAMQASEPNTGWEEMAPFLDDAMSQLSEAERGAILLRYFQNRSLREVGGALGLSEDTAQKRVSRAVDKLHRLLSRKRVAVSGAALTGLLATHAAQLAPPGLNRTVALTALRNASFSTPVHALLQSMLKEPPWLKLVSGASTVLGVAALVVGLIHFWPIASPPSESFTLDANVVTHPRLPSALPVLAAQALEPVVEPDTSATEQHTQLLSSAQSAVSQVASLPPQPFAPANVPRFTLPILEVGKLPNMGTTASNGSSAPVDLLWNPPVTQEPYPTLIPAQNTLPMPGRMYLSVFTNRGLPAAQPSFLSRTTVKPAPTKR
jgi:RNA polymerase sigma factor (sigma-70 family)